MSYTFSAWALARGCLEVYSSPNHSVILFFLQRHSLFLAYKLIQYSLLLPTLQVVISGVFGQDRSPLFAWTKYHQSAYVPLSCHGGDASGSPWTWNPAAHSKILLDEMA